MTTANFCFYLQNRLFQISQTGGQQYSDTSPLVFPGLYNVCDARIPDKLIRITQKCHYSYSISELIKVSTKGFNKMFVELDEIATCH